MIAKEPFAESIRQNPRWGEGKMRDKIGLFSGRVVLFSSDLMKEADEINSFGAVGHLQISKLETLCMNMQWQDTLAFQQSLGINTNSKHIKYLCMT